MSRTRGSTRRTTAAWRARTRGVVAKPGGDQRRGQIATLGAGDRARRSASAAPSGWRRSTRRAPGRARPRRSRRSPSSQATLTAKTGIPKRKLIVPSSGSTTQRRAPSPEVCSALLAEDRVVGPATRQHVADRRSRRPRRRRRPGRWACSWRARPRRGRRTAARSSAAAAAAASRAIASSSCSSIRHHSGSPVLGGTPAPRACALRSCAPRWRAGRHSSTDLDALRAAAGRGHGRRAPRRQLAAPGPDPAAARRVSVETFWCRPNWALAHALARRARARRQPGLRGVAPGRAAR